MTVLPPSALRRLLAALMILTLTLAGAGRGFAAASDGATGLGFGTLGFGVAGVIAPICHAGPGDGSIPPDGTRHDCCDTCALLSPVTLADAPALTGPASVMRYVAHRQAMAWVPAIARRRTPRQSQGPPQA